MLALKIYTNFENKLNYINTLSIKEQRLVVPDLVAKESIQKIFFKHQKVLEERFILRANEFWLQLFNDNFFEYRLLNKSLTKTLIEEWIAQDEIKLSKNSLNQFVNIFDQLLPLVIFPENTLIVSEWFAENQASYIKWGKWYELSKIVWEKFLNHKYIPNANVTSFLLSQLDFSKKYFSKEVIVDLNVELTFQEKELIAQLSQQSDFTILISDYIIKNKNEFLSNSVLIEKVSKENTTFLDKFETSKGKEVFKRFSTQLSEVKEITSQVRRWLDNGGSIDDVALVFPDIEEYYPVIQTYFEKEHIPLKKNTIITANSLKDIYLWMNNLKIKVNNLSKENIELQEYSEENYDLPYEDFKNLFHLYYESTDLARADVLKEKFLAENFEHLKLNKHEFVIWCYSYWHDLANTDTIITILNKIITDTPSSLKLESAKWVAILDDIISKYEIVIRESDVGVTLYNLNQTTWVDKKYIFISGLNEKSLAVTKSQKISNSEVLSILNQTGIVLNTKSSPNATFYVDYFKQKNSVETVYSYPETNFMGDIGAPDLSWLLGAYSLGFGKVKDNPSQNNLDIYQKIIDEKSNERVENDLGSPLQNLKSKNYLKTIRLSNSSLDRYNTCPFIYFTEKIVKLQFGQQLDLDENPLSKGSMYHAIVERLVSLSDMILTDEQIDELLEDCKSKEEIVHLNNKHWLINKSKYKKFTKKFINFEQNYRNEFPESKVKFLEKQFKFFWDQKSKSINGKKGYPIVSVIDRVDVSSDNQYMLTDYKSSKSSVSSYKSWVKNKSLQLILYYLIYEYQLASLGEQEELSGLFYFVLNDWKRDFGIKLKEEGSLLYSIKGKREVIDQQAFTDLVDDVKDIIFTTVESIEQGAIRPQPKKFDTCNSCNWSKACRAPHLI